MVVIQEFQVEKKGETVPRKISKRFNTYAFTCSCQFLTNTGLPCEHIIFFCMKLISCHGKPLYEQLPVEVIKVDHFWKKDVPVILDNDDNDDNEDDLPCPNPTDDDDFDTIVWTSISNAIENSFLKLMKSLSMRKRTVRILHPNKIEVVVVEIRPRGRKVPRLSDVKQRRRKRNLREM